MKIDKQKTLNLFEKIVRQLNHDLYDKSYINILIRTTYRPTYFKKCIESILSQSYKKYKIIISYDDKNCLEYLNPYMNNNKIEIFKAPELDKTIPFFYNLYCNELLNHVKYGWILFLDDDDMLLHKDVLSIIAKNMLRKDNIILWKVLLAEKIEIYPKNLHNIKFGDITTCGLCFHSSYKNLSKWESKKGSDYIYFSKLFEKYYKTDKRIFLNHILTKTIHNRIGQTGEKEAIDLKNIIKNNNIKQAYISNSLEHLKTRFLKKYSLIEYNNNNLNIPTIFFGLYTPEDLKILTTNNINNKFIIFGGSEVANITKIKHRNDLKYISISRNIQDRLLKYNITSTLVNFNLVDHTIFKPLSIREKSIGKKIFVYNGIREKPDNYKIYNQILINKIVKRLSNFEFIFSNTLNLPYEKMPEIYRQCFIGLRLTESDGNANMVQEMEAMNIPVVHNHSDYGLKWKTVDDIVKYINKYNNMNLYDLSDKGVDVLKLINKNILINTHSNLNFTAGDTIMISNYMNLLMKNNNKITLLSKYNVSKTFTRNLESNNYIVIIKENNSEIVKELDIQAKNNDIIFIRNHEILDSLKEKPYLNKTILYGLDIDLNSVKKLNNKYHSIITQSDKLKQLYIKNNIPENKIHIVEPFAYKYDFKLPERNDNEIRLIYCGTLRDEENILEIIEEFQKIHLERPEVVLKMVYGKIHGNIDFRNKVNSYIKNGVKGITFKHNLTHRDACYEIATSDIGICWRKNGWGDNGEISTKVKEYEMYGINIIFDKILFNDKIIQDIKMIKRNIYIFLKTIVSIKNKYNNIKLFPYVLHNSFPYDSGGYATRTHNILNTFNCMYSDKQYFALQRIGYPYDTHEMITVQKFLHEIDNVCYLTLPNLKCYNNLLNLLKHTLNITLFHVASAHKNATPIIKYCNAENLSSIYEIRGMWQITGVSRHMYYNTNYNKSWLDNYVISEKYCIENCSKPLFITTQLQEYALNYKKYLNLSPLNCDIQKTPIFWNCYNIEENTLYKKKIYKKCDKFIIGYAGSMVFYEGIVEIINVIEKLIENNYNIELQLIGNIQPLINEFKKNNKTHLIDVFYRPFVKLYGRVPHKDINDVITRFDLYVIPRLDLPVTNIVSPIKPFEPMSLKIPLLMSDCDCLKEISKNGENCMLFKKNDWEDCFKQIKNIIDIGYPNDIVEQGYNFVKNERNWKYMIEHIGLYDMLD